MVRFNTLSLVCFLNYVVYGFEFTPTILSEECGQVEQQKEIHTIPNDCPYIVDISAFTDDSETLYISSTTYIIKLYANSSNTDGFRGFIIQARSSVDNMPVGTFIYTSTEYQLQCGDHSAITHYNDNARISVSLMWKSPPPETGTIRFRYTFVKDNSTFWAGLYTDPILESVTVVKRHMGESGSGAGTINNSMHTSLTESETATLMPSTSEMTTAEMTTTTAAEMITTSAESATPTVTTSSASTESVNMTSPTVGRAGGDNNDELSVGAVAGLVVGLITFSVIVAGLLAIGVSLWLHYKKTSRTVRVTKIAPDKSPLVVKPAVPMTHMSSGKHP